MSITITPKVYAVIKRESALIDLIPVLSQNGTVGTDDFAVSFDGSASAWEESNWAPAYNGFDNNDNTHVTCIQNGCFLDVYCKQAICPQFIVGTNFAEKRTPKTGKILYSDDGVTYTEAGTWQADDEKRFFVWTNESTESAHNYWRIYFTDSYEGANGSGAHLTAINFYSCGMCTKAWKQPALTSNGTWNGNSFAVKKSDGSVNACCSLYLSSSGYTNLSMSTGDTVTYYFPEPVKICRMLSATIHAATIWHSDDEVNWKQFAGWTAGSWTGDSVADTICTSGYHKYYQIRATSSGNINNVAFLAVTKSELVLKADVSRSIEKSIHTFNDSARNVSNSYVLNVDSSRNINLSQNTSNDTARLLNKSLSILPDIQRILSQPITLYFDINRETTASYVEVTVNADTYRFLDLSVSIGFDIETITKNIVSIDSDLLRIVNLAQTIQHDLSRQINRKQIVQADMQRIFGIRIIFFADMQMEFVWLEDKDVTLPFDTHRIVNVSSYIYADTFRRHDSSCLFHVDTFRILERAGSISCDTRRDIPREINAPVNVLDGNAHTEPIYGSEQNENTFVMPAAENMVNGLQSIEIAMQAASLTDVCSFVISNSDVGINTIIRGTILDYPYSLMVERTKQDGILQTVGLTTDVDGMLYTIIHYKLGPNYVGNTRRTVRLNGVTYTQEASNNQKRKYYSASKHISAIAAALGKNLVSRFGDFVSTAEGDMYGASYQSLIDSLFGWTSKLPQRLINVYIRNDTLYVIQRGMEANVIDISGMRHTHEIVSRELVRSIWNNATTETMPVRSSAGGSDYETDKGESSDGDDIDWQSPYTEEDYSRTEGEDGSYTISMTTRHYSYVLALNDAVMLVSEREVNRVYKPTASSVTVENGMEIYRGGGSKVTSERITTTDHTYDGYGFHHTKSVTTQDGITIATRTTKTLGSTEGVTNFRRGRNKDAKKKTPTDSGSGGGNVNNGGTLRGEALIDTEFPVVGDGMLSELTSAINWLNRKIKETVEVSVYDNAHIFGFDDRIVLNGTEYFIESNRFVRNTTVVNRQDLILVRWY